MRATSCVTPWAGGATTPTASTSGAPGPRDRATWQPTRLGPEMQPWLQVLEKAKVKT